MSYTNDGPKVQYQLIVSWKHSCGVCIGFDHQVGPFWPTPFHRNCSCKQVSIYPGATAEPFVDYRAKIQTLSRPRQSDVMGASNLAMVEAGLVQWGDVVTSGRIRTLREVVSRNSLTVDQMVAARVKRSEAEEAWKAVHTGTHTAIEERRQKLVDQILTKGYTPSQVKDAFGRGIAAKASIGEPPAAPPIVPVPQPKPAPPSRPAAQFIPNPAMVLKPTPRPAISLGDWRARLARVLQELKRRFGVIPKGD